MEFAAGCLVRYIYRPWPRFPLPYSAANIPLPPLSLLLPGSTTAPDSVSCCRSFQPLHQTLLILWSSARNDRSQSAKRKEESNVFFLSRVHVA